MGHLVALSDGSEAFDFSTSGGVIRRGYHEKVKSAALDLCGLAERLGSVGSIVTDSRLLAPRRIRFYVLTTEGGAECR